MKPDWCPQGIWEAASKAVPPYVSSNIIAEIARALIAEREACASLADDHSQALRGNFDRSSAIAVEGIANAIRSRP